MAIQEQDKTMYTASGNAVRLIQEVPGGYVAAPLYEDDEHYEGDPEFYQSLFTHPPIERQHEAIRNLEQQIDTLRKQRDEIRDSLKEAEQASKAAESRIKALAQYKQLELLEDFMAGNITHYVDCGSSYVSIHRFVRGKDEKNKDNEFGRDDLDNFKLVTLFGRSNGDLQWRISQYKDGSGGYNDVYLCRSEEEAKAKALEVVTELVHRPQGINEYIVKIAAAYGVEIPQDKLKAYFDLRRSSLQNNIDNYTSAIKKWKQEIEQMPQ